MLYRIMAKSSKTMICTCKSVKNDSFNWDKNSKFFKNTKNGSGNCFCEINNNSTGKRTKVTKINDVLLTQKRK